MSRVRNPFRPGVVLAVLAVGAAAFLLMLYALGQGWDGSTERNGGEHAASNGLTGFAALADILDSAGYDVELSRSPAAQSRYGLLILTPPVFGDAEEFVATLDQRREADEGPTIVILPKWMSQPIPPALPVEAEEGWVFIGDPMPPQYLSDFDFFEGGKIGVGETDGWNGLGRSGTLPDAERVQAMVEQPDAAMRPVIVDGRGDVLVAEMPPPESARYDDYDSWKTYIVFEPDLLNNYGMADEGRARLAAALIESVTDGESDMPIVFDLTLSGLGESANLLTLAFSPPFLAATLCLLFAALVIAWRAFARFGPPVAEGATIAHGKRQLARNGASLVARAKRFHLLAEPYAALMGRRIADALGVRETQREARDAAVSRALERRGHEGTAFSQRLASLRGADNPKDIIRAARALKEIERTLER